MRINTKERGNKRIQMSEVKLKILYTLCKSITRKKIKWLVDTRTNGKQNVCCSQNLLKILEKKERKIQRKGGK